MGLTLGQVLRRLESLARSHKQINTVLVVDYDEALDQQTLVYPACVIELQKDGHKVSLQEKLTTYRIKVYFFDLLDTATNSLENEIDIKSELSSIAQDFHAMLGYHEYQYDWVIGAANFSIANYQLLDLCVGASIDLGIGTWYDGNRCQVPADGVTFETDNSMKIITNFTHDVTAEATEVTLTAMINREILMFWLGDKLLKATTSVPGPNEYRYTAATGRFEFGTTIQVDQVIQILNRSL